MGLSNYAENAVGNHLLRNTALTSPTTVYLALHDGDAGETGANEITGLGGYAREAIAFDAPTDGVFDSSAEESFTASGEAWGTITHASIWDAVSGGNCIITGALAASKAVADGDTLRFAAGAVTATFT
jgi:hypothetical protein